MSETVLAEVFTADEVARAAGVAAADVQACLAAGEIRRIAGTPYIAGADAIRLGRRLKPAAVAGRGQRDLAIGAWASSAVHASLVAAVVWFSSGAVRTETVDERPASPTRLVFVMSPGAGGGGGGGGLRNPLPPARARRRAPERHRISVPPVAEPVTPAPTLIVRAPEPPPPLNAQVVPAAADVREQEGVVERGDEVVTSQGPGASHGAGTGQGAGSGDGTGSGIGEGLGGGAGGGPYRPGSGIEPPRLLREVKAVYTENARRRGLTGDVLLEIVVRRDGSVGEVSVLRALGAGLDERAIEAVRQWRFAPARRHGAPVDVIVEVAVEFTLR
ncbi:MAG: energy transducer TonB [Acidobacteria bacterium]|nr:energy transducer TonB [Acidobacteriota bacterium]